MAPALTIRQQTDAAKDGKLLGAACENGHHFAEAKARCPQCGSASWETVELPTEGKVLTFTIQNVAAEAFLNDTPFAWAIIELDDGTRTSGWVPYVSTDRDLAIGDRVKFDPGYVAGLRFQKV